jgi:hypothetical protein
LGEVGIAWLIWGNTASGSPPSAIFGRTRWGISWPIAALAALYPIFSGHSPGMTVRPAFRASWGTLPCRATQNRWHVPSAGFEAFLHGRVLADHRSLPFASDGVDHDVGIGGELGIATVGHPAADSKLQTARWGRSRICRLVGFIGWVCAFDVLADGNIAGRFALIALVNLGNSAAEAAARRSSILAVEQRSYYRVALAALQTTCVAAARSADRCQPCRRP